MSAAARRLVRVDLGPRSYDVVCGEGLLAEAGARIAPLCPRGRAVIVTDETVAGLHLSALDESLGAAGVRADAVVIPAGEASKSWRELERVCEFLLTSDLERGEPVIALGGGVVGDLAGLAAALYKRGAAFVQVPTTVLAQVDSSVGGKTAINAARGKNMIGAFHQPALVLADASTLDTLPERDLRAGFAEVVKYAVIADAAFFDWLAEHADDLLSGRGGARAEAVARSVAHKAAIVAADEREAGPRALLNLGHTFAHAFEALAGYESGLRHGEAVGAGLALAAGYAAESGLCAAADAISIERLLESFRLSADPRALTGAPFDADAVLTAMRRDKKASAGVIRLVLPRRIGAAEIIAERDEARLLSFLRERLQ